MKRKYGFSLLVLLMVSACTWVKVKPGAENVRISTAAEVAHCERIGPATTSALKKVGIITRSDQKLKKELEVLARNQAAQMGGNAVVAESAISSDGSQQFGVYNCR